MWKASGESGPGLPQIAPPPKIETRNLPLLEATEEEWLCAFCHNHVANESDRFRYEGNDQFSFTNPEGIRFQILTFSETCGCRETGLPTLEHTWFPGHAWSYCQCGGCGQHLGWYFAGKHRFAGLIVVRIVRALHLRN